MQMFGVFVVLTRKIRFYNNIKSITFITFKKEHDKL